MRFVGQRRRSVWCKVIECRAGKAVSGLLKRHRLNRNLGMTGVANIEAAPFLWSGNGRDSDGSQQDQRTPSAMLAASQRPCPAPLKPCIKIPRMRFIIS